MQAVHGSHGDCCGPGTGEWSHTTVILAGNGAWKAQRVLAVSPWRGFRGFPLCTLRTHKEVGVCCSPGRRWGSFPLTGLPVLPDVLLD